MRDIIQVSDVVEEEQGLAAFVTLNTTYDIQGQKYLQQTYMIAVSKDKGTQWRFSSQGKPEQEQHYTRLFPRLTEAFSYPETFFRKRQ
jgi:hypothetical protein